VAAGFQKEFSHDRLPFTTSERREGGKEGMPPASIVLGCNPPYIKEEEKREGGGGSHL